jgi:nicotinamide mononucleotide adenylyltransferase
MVYEADDTSHFHIVPVGDLRDHEADPRCWCRPTEDEEDPGIWVHHAMDGREQYEQGRMKH